MSWTALQNKLIEIEALFDTVGSDDIGVLLESLDDKDYSTETTLAALKDVFDTAGTDNVGALIESLETIQDTYNDIEDSVVVNTSVTFADTAKNGDIKTINIPAPTGEIKRNQLYMIHVYNGSDTTTISVNLNVDWEDSDANNRTVSYSEFTDLATLTADSIPEEAHILYNGGILEVVNGADLTTGDGYDVYVKVVRI